jgi:hypothetical protein
MSYARTSPKGVVFYNSKKAYRGVTLFTPTQGKGAWLIDMTGQLINHWKIPYHPGSDAKLLPNGNLLYAGKVDDGPLADIEGAGGILLEVDWDGKVVWEYKDPYLHHAFDRMINGNTLVLKWGKVPSEIAAKVKGGDVGSERDGVMWGDIIQEITPEGKVAWEWIAHEHLDPETAPRCPICPRDTWTHSNAVGELPDANILISFMKSNTIATIDKKTGNINWRWGEGELAHQHCPTILDNGNILVFDNGFHPYGFAWGFSRVIEVSPETDKMVWVYGGQTLRTEFYSSILGSCQRLPNGDTLICEGTTGRIFEVNESDEIVWEFGNNLPSCEPYPAQTRSQMVCSAYRYGVNYAGLKGPVSQPVEKEPAPGTEAKGEELATEPLPIKVQARLGRLGY